MKHQREGVYTPLCRYSCKLPGFPCQVPIVHRYAWLRSSLLNDLPPAKATNKSFGFWNGVRIHFR